MTTQPTLTPILGLSTVWWYTGPDTVAPVVVECYRGTLEIHGSTVAAVNQTDSGWRVTGAAEHRAAGFITEARTRKAAILAFCAEYAPALFGPVYDHPRRPFVPRPCRYCGYTDCAEPISCGL